MKTLKLGILAFCLSSLFAAEKDVSAHDLYSAAKAAQQEARWGEVIKNSKAVAQHYENSPFAADALFMMGAAYFEIEEYELANECFTDYLKKQTTPEDFEQAIRYKFEIAHRFGEGAKLHLMGWKSMPKWLSAKDYAVEIYDEVIATLPRHELASEALYQKANLLYEIKDFKPAIDAYQTLIRRFPKHARAPDSYLGICQVYIKWCETDFKDPDFLDLAEINVRKFEADFPGEERLADAKGMLLSMKERYATDLLEMGKFYERTKKPQAAGLYYHNLKARYPETKSAKEAEKRLKKLNYSFPELPQ